MIIPIPKYNELEIPSEDWTPEFALWFMDCPSWKCSKCGAVIFGRIKYCVYCKMVLHVDTPRPEDYDERSNR